ncbi:PREDICTED: uncharacterized protein LOC104733756 [Camelina sativa]|uniref:Uncharacterized protein LOC104733756 n=1 Tax=Camelina sativa TaxID=90675 RepID=A0ABM0V6G9_CAMSA|nr:PREDICTED: uncharacterized protein LOC104733756 [Camelina sativa]
MGFVVQLGYWKTHRTLIKAHEYVRDTPESGYAELPLNSVIPDDEELALISDRHKSIGKAIAKVYPLASRGICTYHLHKNIILRFSGSEIFRLVKKAAAAYRVVDFEEIFQQIQKANPQLHAYLVHADVSKWSRAHFRGDRYNFTTSNIAESLNKVLNPARAYPIVELLEAVQNMLTRWFATRRKQAAAMPTLHTKGVENLLQARIEHSRRLRVQEIDEDRFQVSCGTSTHVVNLRDSLCSGYAESIMPIDTSCIVPTDVTPSRCKPPFVRNPPGRPKMSRMKSFVEVALETKRPRKQHACSQCQQVGHNRTTCPANT